MTAPLPLVGLLGVLGLAIGSFLNVVIYRVPRQQSILFPASHCPSCDEPIKTRHNVPVLGWLMLRGRCATCRQPISPRYPLVEAGTAALFIAVTLRFGISLQLPAYLFMAAVGLTLAMIDFDVHRLPDSIVLPAYIVSVLLLMPAGAGDGAWWPASRALLGAIALGSIYFTLALAYPVGATFGDAKLAGLLGFYLGWLSWPAVLIGALGGLAVAAVGGVITGSGGVTGPGSVKSPGAVTGSADPAAEVGVRSIALGTCLVVAAGTAVFFTTPVVSWYGSLVGAS
ncbi:prepilin peptidase [Jatrophihabitans sp.]|uniref:prepilin peptidase n=1 Tax=Jatrophihabitans sp. TaxID=1932789 RepID=UPI0030C772B3|nr:putative prepilin peptidase [Jatrophihabitans sp.]